MPNWRRAFLPGGMFFFTVVTYQRHPLFQSSLARQLLGDAIRKTRQIQPFTIEAIVLLPDHLHTIWALPRGDADFSGRWSWIKREFTTQWLAAGGAEKDTTSAQSSDRRRGVWQRKYWEHSISDEDEMIALLDYIHFNPVKHGHARCPADWEWSSFHKWVRRGQYEPDWGCREPFDESKHAPLKEIVGE
ncbi:transposase [Bremerella sp. JC770]|uniref:REP-associated tyrosine transposase n=1 Tax=Bremerella sp. JC770 TaxID=3232137 RepID=UPI00345B0C4A